MLSDFRLLHKSPQTRGEKKQEALRRYLKGRRHEARYCSGFTKFAKNSMKKKKRNASHPTSDASYLERNKGEKTQTPLAQPSCSPFGLHNIIGFLFHVLPSFIFHTISAPPWYFRLLRKIKLSFYTCCLYNNASFDVSFLPRILSMLLPTFF